MIIPEKFLQFIWQHKLYFATGHKTTHGLSVEIINPGQLNTDSGPDFFNAQIRIDGTLWAGNVEIHANTLDWNRHKHNTDPAYNNVILHIVAESNNVEILTQSNRAVPEMILRFATTMYDNYKLLIDKKNIIKCADTIRCIPTFERNAWLERLLAERFEERTRRVENLLKDFNGDWEQVLFTMLARTMGFVVNAEPMEILARNTPVKILMKHNNELQANALLLGQAGMLEGSNSDEYSATLQREYALLKQKFDLHPMAPHLWKTLRLRPYNFPAIRLSQLAKIVSSSRGNLSNTLATFSIEHIYDSLNICASKYWDNHYQLNGEQTDISKPKHLGRESQRLIIINTIIPFLYAKAYRYGDTSAQENAMKMMQLMSPEKNSKINSWIECGIEPRDEGEAQALLLLLKNYCAKNRCLQCRFVMSIKDEKMN